MSAETHPVYELKLERKLNAPVERVWEALTEAGEIARWYGPGDEYRIEVLEWECREGGTYRVAMHHGEGETHTCYGVFKGVEPNRRLAYSWSWEGQPPMDTLVTFTLAAEGAGTRLDFTHEGFPAEEAREQHRAGWMGSLERLAATVS